MNMNFIIKNIARDLKLGEQGVRNTAGLLEEGSTIPFISRYRKERTGGMSETDVREIADKLEYYKELEKRKESILKTITEQGKLSSSLERKIRECKDKTQLEDLYLPYKPKKRTRATVAREKGLEPLAELIWKQEDRVEDKKALLESYINPEKGVESQDQALQGARDIIAEKISDSEAIRGWMRDHVKQSGFIVSRAKRGWEDKSSKFEDYYDFRESLQKIPSHRMMAIRRGAKEGILSWHLEADEEKILDFMERQVITNKSFSFRKELKEAVSDSLKRLIFPSIEKESFNMKMEGNEREAIEVFSRNLKNLLLASPAGSRSIMGVDPGIRTGCKVAVIDRQGDFQEFFTIYLSGSRDKREQGARELVKQIKKYKIELIAIGNGTFSKETDTFIRDLVREHKLEVTPVVVNEAGASVYSASPNGVKEFPHLDVTARGAISIARRLQDPLAELVKIDPKSIGVGQYQHDVNQKELKKSLDRTVESCVNYVGVELNTASVELLAYISGVGSGVAENIAQYRSTHGPFKNRKELLKVSKLGPKLFEQCAGFLRVRESSQPLDNSSIHPEAYFIVEKMAGDLKIPVKEMIGNKEAIKEVDKKRYITGEFGLPTITDILTELKKPGLDPRKEFRSIKFSSYINDIEDLSPEMILEGVVTNVTNFGAFVDIGVHQDGLVHISKLSDSFISDPHDVIAVGDPVRVKVLEIDLPRKRISLEKMN